MLVRSIFLNLKMYPGGRSYIHSASLNTVKVIFVHFLWCCVLVFADVVGADSHFSNTSAVFTVQEVIIIPSEQDRLDSVNDNTGW